jgi:hypothetical protein
LEREVLKNKIQYRIPIEEVIKMFQIKESLRKKFIFGHKFYLRNIDVEGDDLLIDCEKD